MLREMEIIEMERQRILLVMCAAHSVKTPKVSSMKIAAHMLEGVLTGVPNP
jgi:hypothetical protein